MPIPHHILKEPSIDRAVDILLRETVEAGSSELVLEPQLRDAVARMRRDGLMHELFRQPKQAHRDFMARLKRLAHLRDDAPLAFQEGGLRRWADGASIEAHLSIVPVMEGEKAVLRFRSATPRFDGLGLSETHRAPLQRMLQKKNGLILLAGPRRSGRTTTLRALLEVTGPLRRQVLLIASRDEGDLLGAEEEHIDAVAGRTASSLLRGAVARGAEIIGLDALRDEEAAAIAVSAAAHRLVIAVVEARDISSAFLSLLDLRVESRSAARALSGVLMQRLVRRACPECRRRETLTRTEASVLGWPSALAKRLFENTETQTFTRGGKCDACLFTGHQGQIGVFELRDLTSAGRRQPTLLDDGARKVLAGTIAPEEVFRL